MKERIPVGDYKDIQRHKYRGIEFFTAIFKDWIICEPTHVELIKILDTFDLDGESLWSTSDQIWAEGLSLDKQRSRLIEGAEKYIDYLLDGGKINDCVKKQNEELIRIIEQRKKIRELIGE